MSETISEIRKRAWDTRRQKYGKQGHHGTYGRGPGVCGDCARMREWLIRLHIDGVLSEGQAVKATGLDRITVREHSDEMVNSGTYIPVHRVENSFWQPIQTAPKDGTRVLLWSVRWSAPHTGQFYGEKWMTVWEIGPFKHQPTHWQPLPEPPAA